MISLAFLPVVSAIYTILSKWYTMIAVRAQECSARFLSEHSEIEAFLTLVLETCRTRIQSVLTVFKEIASKLYLHPIIQNVVLHPQFQNLINHPLLQSLIDHPQFKSQFQNQLKNYPSNTLQTTTAAQAFIQEFSVWARKDDVDASKVTLTFLSTPGKFRNILNKFQTIENDSVAADNFIWICSCVAIMCIVTSSSWLAILLSSYGSKYRGSVTVIGLFVSALLSSFFVFFSMKVKSLGDEAESLRTFLVTFSYIPFSVFITSIVCVSTYVLYYGMNSRKHVIAENILLGEKNVLFGENNILLAEYSENISTLQKELIMLNGIHTQSISDLDMIRDHLRASEVKFESVTAAHESHLESFKAALLLAETTRRESIREWREDRILEQKEWKEERTSEQHKFDNKIIAKESTQLNIQQNMETSIDGYRLQLENSRKETESSRRETESIIRGLQSSKKETEDSRRETETSRRETESTRREVDASKKETENSVRETDVIRSELDGSRKETESTRRELETSRKETAATAKELEESQREVQSSRKETEDSKREVEGRIRELEESRKETESTINALQDSRRETENLTRNLTNLQVQFTAIELEKRNVETDRQWIKMEKKKIEMERNTTEAEKMEIVCQFEKEVSDNIARHIERDVKDEEEKKVRDRKREENKNGREKVRLEEEKEREEEKKERDVRDREKEKERVREIQEMVTTRLEEEKDRDVKDNVRDEKDRKEEMEREEKDIKERNEREEVERARVERETLRDNEREADENAKEMERNMRCAEMEEKRKTEREMERKEREAERIAREERDIERDERENERGKIREKERMKEENKTLKLIETHTEKEEKLALAYAAKHKKLVEEQEKQKRYHEKQKEQAEMQADMRQKEYERKAEESIAEQVLLADKLANEVVKREERVAADAVVTAHTVHIATNIASQNMEELRIILNTTQQERIQERSTLTAEISSLTGRLSIITDRLSSMTDKHRQSESMREENNNNNKTLLSEMEGKLNKIQQELTKSEESHTSAVFQVKSFFEEVNEVNNKSRLLTVESGVKHVKLLTELAKRASTESERELWLGERVSKGEGADCHHILHCIATAKDEITAEDLAGTTLLKVLEVKRNIVEEEMQALKIELNNQNEALNKGTVTCRELQDELQATLSTLHTTQSHLQESKDREESLSENPSTTIATTNNLISELERTVLTGQSNLEASGEREKALLQELVCVRDIVQEGEEREKVLRSEQIALQLLLVCAEGNVREGKEREKALQSERSTLLQNLTTARDNIIDLENNLTTVRDSFSEGVERERGLSGDLEGMHVDLMASQGREDALNNDIDTVRYKLTATEEREKEVRGELACVRNTVVEGVEREKVLQLELGSVCATLTATEERERVILLEIESVKEHVTAVHTDGQERERELLSEYAALEVILVSTKVNVREGEEREKVLVGEQLLLQQNLTAARDGIITLEYNLTTARENVREGEKRETMLLSEQSILMDNLATARDNIRESEEREVISQSELSVLRESLTAARDNIMDLEHNLTAALDHITEGEEREKALLSEQCILTDNLSTARNNVIDFENNLTTARDNIFTLESQSQELINTLSLSTEGDIILRAELASSLFKITKTAMELQECKSQLQLSEVRGGEISERENVLILFRDELQGSLAVSNNNLNDAYERENTMIEEMNALQVLIDKNEENNEINIKNTSYLQCQVDELNGEKKIIEEKNQFLLSHLTESNQQITMLEESYAANLITSKIKLTEIEGEKYLIEQEKNVIEREKEVLLSKLSSLRVEVEQAGLAVINGEIAHATSMGELLVKLSQSQDSVRIVTLDYNSSKDMIKAMTDEMKDLKELNDKLNDKNGKTSEKSSDLLLLLGKLEESERIKTDLKQEIDEIKEKLKEQKLKNEKDEASSEEELKDMENQLKSFLEVCNATREVLVGAQEDLRTSEIRRTEDVFQLELKLKEAETLRLSLVSQCDANRTRLVELEVENINNHSKNEGTLDEVKGQLEASEMNLTRYKLQLEDQNIIIQKNKEELLEIIDRENKKDNSLLSSQQQVDTYKHEKDTLKVEYTELESRLQSALEAISFFEKERQEDIEAMQRELNNSVKTRKKIIADFDVAKSDLEAEERVRRSSIVSTSSPFKVRMPGVDGTGGSVGGGVGYESIMMRMGGSVGGGMGSDDGYYSNSMSNSPLSRRGTIDNGNIDTNGNIDHIYGSGDRYIGGGINDAALTAAAMVEEYSALKNKVSGLLIAKEIAETEVEMVRNRLENALTDLESVKSLGVKEGNEVRDIMGRMRGMEEERVMMFTERDEMKYLVSSAQLLSDQAKVQVTLAKEEREVARSALLIAETALEAARERKEEEIAAWNEQMLAGESEIEELRSELLRSEQRSELLSELLSDEIAIRRCSSTSIDYVDAETGEDNGDNSEGGEGMGGGVVGGMALRNSIKERNSTNDTPERSRNGGYNMSKDLNTSDNRDDRDEKEKSFIRDKDDSHLENLNDSLHSSYSTNSTTDFNIEELSRIHAKGALIVQELKDVDLDLRVLRAQIKASKQNGAEDVDFFTSPLHIISPNPTPIKVRRPSKRLKGEVDRAQESVCVLNRLLEEMNASRVRLEAQVDENKLNNDEDNEHENESMFSHNSIIRSYSPYYDPKRNAIPTTINPMRTIAPLNRMSSSSFSSTVSHIWGQHRELSLLPVSMGGKSPSVSPVVSPTAATNGTHATGATSATHNSSNNGTVSTAGSGNVSGKIFSTDSSDVTSVSKLFNNNNKNNNSGNNSGRSIPSNNGIDISPTTGVVTPELRTLDQNLESARASIGSTWELGSVASRKGGEESMGGMGVGGGMRGGGEGEGGEGDDDDDEEEEEWSLSTTIQFPRRSSLGSVTSLRSIGSMDEIPPPNPPLSTPHESLSSLSDIQNIMDSIEKEDMREMGEREERRGMMKMGEGYVVSGTSKHPTQHLTQVTPTTPMAPTPIVSSGHSAPITPHTPHTPLTPLASPTTLTPLVQNSARKPQTPLTPHSSHIPHTPLTPQVSSAPSRPTSIESKENKRNSFNNNTKNNNNTNNTTNNSTNKNDPHTSHIPPRAPLGRVFTPQNQSQSHASKDKEKKKKKETGRFSVGSATVVSSDIDDNSRLDPRSPVLSTPNPSLSTPLSTPSHSRVSPQSTACSIQSMSSTASKEYNPQKGDNSSLKGVLGVKTRSPQEGASMFYSPGVVSPISTCSAPHTPHTPITPVAFITPVIPVTPVVSVNMMSLTEDHDTPYATHTTHTTHTPHTAHTAHAPHTPHTQQTINTAHVTHVTHTTPYGTTYTTPVTTPTNNTTSNNNFNNTNNNSTNNNSCPSATGTTPTHHTQPLALKKGSNLPIQKPRFSVNGGGTTLLGSNLGPNSTPTSRPVSTSSSISSAVSSATSSRRNSKK